MTNEAILIQDLEREHLEITMADGGAGSDIEKGTILKLADDNTGSASSADGDIFHGILLSENVGADGQTRYAVGRGGVWDIKLTANNLTVAVGNMLKISGANLLDVADEDVVELHSEVVGMALEAASEGSGETIEVLVGAH